MTRRARASLVAPVDSDDGLPCHTSLAEPGILHRRENRHERVDQGLFVLLPCVKKMT